MDIFTWKIKCSSSKTAHDFEHGCTSACIAVLSIYWPCPHTHILMYIFLNVDIYCFYIQFFHQFFSSLLGFFNSPTFHSLTSFKWNIHPFLSLLNNLHFFLEYLSSFIFMTCFSGIFLKLISYIINWILISLLNIINRTLILLPEFSYY